jgi:lipoyl(octanoyl) transferase
MTAEWRLLIEDSPIEGAWNMALDRAVQLAREEGSSSPTLRLYRWLRPTVTLGRFQDAAGVDREFCESSGVDVVRRFTGGRGVLHDDELTYSIVAGVADGIPRGTAASYRMLCTALVEAYQLLGVDAALTARPRGEGSSAACYLHTTPADLSLGAMKLSGSAQVWLGGTVLQHGSFTITRDVDREARAFRLSDDSRARLDAQTATLADALGRRPTIEDVREACVEGLQRAFGVRLVPGVVSERELQLAAEALEQTSADTVPRRGSVRGSS